MFKPPPGNGDGRSTIGEAGPKILVEFGVQYVSSIYLKKIYRIIEYSSLKQDVQKYQNTSEVIIKLESFSLLVHNANGGHVSLQICMTSKCNKTKNTV